MRIVSTYYENIIKYDYITKFIGTSFVPKLCKVTLLVDCKGKRPLKSLVSLALSLELISSQKPILVLKKNTKNVNLKVKQGIPVVCKVTLRNKKLLNIILSTFFHFDKSCLGFSKLNSKFFSNKNSIQFSINNFSEFHFIEENFFLFKDLDKIKVSLVSNSKSSAEFFFLLRSFKVI